jgi:DNA-binding NarL/FixJ family response regulator
MTIPVSQDASQHIPPVDDLTERQREVLRLVTLGHSNRKIAEELMISPATVENHLHTIFGKLGVRSRTEAAVVAVLSGLFAAGEDEGTPS